MRSGQQTYIAPHGSVDDRRFEVVAKFLVVWPIPLLALRALGTPKVSLKRKSGRMGGKGLHNIGRTCTSRTLYVFRTLHRKGIGIAASRD